MGACEHGNATIVKALLANPECDATAEDNVSIDLNLKTFNGN